MGFIQAKSQGKKPKPERVVLILPGGGSLCAHQAGALIAFLRSEEVQSGAIEISEIRGTSGGAINTALLAAGMAQGGPNRAIKNLEEFWTGLAHTPSVPDAFLHATKLSDKAREISEEMVSHQIRVAKIFARLPFMKPLIEYQMKAAHIHLTAIEAVRHVPFMNTGNFLERLLEKTLNEDDFQAIRNGKIRVQINAVDRQSGAEIITHNSGFSMQRVLESTKLKLISGPHENLDGAYANNPNLDHLSTPTEMDRILIFGTQKPPNTQIYPAHQREVAGLSGNETSKQPLTWETYHHIALLSQTLRPKGIDVDVCQLQHEETWGEEKKLDSTPEWIFHLLQQGEQDYAFFEHARKNYPNTDFSSHAWLHHRQIVETQTCKSLIMG